MEAKDCKLRERVDSVDIRVTALEEEMRKLRTDCQTGFGNNQLAINQLAKDFAQRMNTLDQRIVEEKAKADERADAQRAKWHDCVRRIVLWASVTILSGAGVAMGVSVWEHLASIK